MVGKCFNRKWENGLHFVLDVYGPADRRERGSEREGERDREKKRELKREREKERESNADKSKKIE